MASTVRKLKIALLMSAALLTSACESPEERAESYYQSALELLDEGDIERALLEMRNVFKYNGFHFEARKLYAETVLSQGNIHEAYSQYLRLIEQYPDTAEVRITLAELALDQSNWDEVERHGSAAIELAPEDMRVRAIAAALQYRDATMGQDEDLRASATKEAREVIEQMPANRAALRITLDDLTRGERSTDALPLIEAALATEADALDLHVLKFQLLSFAGDTGTTSQQIERMAELFPDNPEVRQTLLSWYMQQEDYDAVEAVLRDLAGPLDGETGGHVTLVRFLERARGEDAARQELERLVEANAGTDRADLYRSIRASLQFDTGEEDAAIAELQEILDAAAPSNQTRQIQVTLARLLEMTGNSVGARELVEAVLEQDLGHVEALKMRAAWAIADDRPGDAINDLRSAAGQAPRDAEIMTLMAEAHERSGDLDLTGERLAKAVEVSGGAVKESLRYVSFLLTQNRPQAARNVLTDARRLAPQDLKLIGMTAQLALQSQEWLTVNALFDELKAIGTPAAEEMATDLRTAQLMGQNRIGETYEMLEGQIAEGGEAAERAVTLLILAKLRDGDTEGARRALEEARADRPDDLHLKLLSANLHMAADAPNLAEQDLRDVLKASPADMRAVQQLYALLTVQAQPEAAAAVLDSGLATRPDSAPLLLLKAVQLESEGDFDGAIEIYARMYEEDSSQLVVANNLASLIATYVEDPEQLQRAAVIAQRLRGRQVPAFQDTWGWISYRRGNLEEALPNLRAAAEGLPEDPMVQYHFGAASAAAGETEQAQRTLQMALRLWGDNAVLQAEAARTLLAEVEAGAGAAARSGSAADPSN